MSAYPSPTIFSMNPMSNILIIDDSPPIAQLIQEMVGLIGHTAETAENGREGLAKVKQLSPDLILLDIMMPDMNGWMVYDELRKFSRVPVIFITASDTATNRNRAAELGELLLSKEVTLMSLKKHIDEVLQKGQSKN